MLEMDKDIEKTLVVGDMHCKQHLVLPRVNKAIEKWGPERVVFLGDYGDEWGSTASSVLSSLRLQREWAEYKRESGIEVVFLAGNHDFEYLRGGTCSGMHAEAAEEIKAELEGLGLKMALTAHGRLMTHAGVTRTLLAAHAPRPRLSPSELASWLDGMLGEGGDAWDALGSCGPGRGGTGIPGPLWADKAELSCDYPPLVPQVVGHTPVKDCRKLRPFSGGEDMPEIWACDTFSVSQSFSPLGNGEMLLVSDDGAEPVGAYLSGRIGPWRETVRTRLGY